MDSETALVVMKVIGLLGSWFNAVFPFKQPKKDNTRAAQLVNEGIRELLSTKPDLLDVRAKLSEARDLSSVPTGQLLRAEKMLEKVEKYDGRLKKALPKKSPKKKTTKKTAKKKAAKKKSAKKK